MGCLERPAEIVHGEHVFEELGLLEVADAAGLPCGIELVSHGVGAGVEVVIVARLVNAHAPQDDGGVVPVAANHTADVVHGDVLPGRIADVLPAGNLLEDQQTDLVAGVEEVARLRVVRGAHDIAVKVLAQDDGVAALHASGHGLSDPGESLMAVEAAQLDDGAVEREALRREARLAEADAARVVVEQICAAQQAHFNAIELGRTQIPELDGAQVVEVQRARHVAFVRRLPATAASSLR